MKSKAQIYGHPLHPMLVLLPSGAFIIALILDLLYVFEGSMLWWEASLPVLVIGVIGAVIAFIPGLIDLATIVPRKKASKIGVIHMGVNVMMTILFAVNAMVRWAATTPPAEAFYAAFILSIVGVILLTIGGWLGGTLVYEHQVGVLGEGEAEADRKAREEKREQGFAPDLQESETPA